MNMKDQFRTFIAESFSYEINGIGDETELLESDIIDSTGVMELVFFIADQFGFEVDAGDIVPENFNSINGLANFVQEKTAVPVA